MVEPELLHCAREVRELVVDVLGGLCLSGDDIANRVTRPVQDVEEAILALGARAVGSRNAWQHIAPVWIGGDRTRSVAISKVGCDETHQFV